MSKEFIYKNNHWVCQRCGSIRVSIISGFMVDRLICNDCYNEDYV